MTDGDMHEVSLTVNGVQFDETVESRWSLADFPLMLVAEITLEGVLFAPIAAAVTTWWMLRWKGDA